MAPATCPRGRSSCADEVVALVRTAAVVLVWAAATIVVFGAALSALVGRADFGDGKDPPVSPAGAVGLVVLAFVAIALALWLTRLLRRGG
jgi:hypothetical protein